MLAVPSVKRLVRRDVGFALLLAAVAIIAFWPGRNGDGTSISHMQLVGNIGAVCFAAIGLNLLTGMAGMASFGQGGFYAIGAYVSAWLALDHGVSPLLAIVLAVAVSGLGGTLVALGSVRLRGPQLAMITLVLAVVVQRILAQEPTFGRLSGYPNPTQHGTGLLDPLEVFGTKLQPPLFSGQVATVVVAILVLLVIVAVLSRNIIRSPWGQSLRAVRESELLAAHLGVDVTRRKVAVFTLAAALAGLGGVCYVQVYAHLQPESFTYMLGVNMLLMVVFGGAGTVIGPLVGAVFVMWLQQSDAIASVAQFQQDHISEHWYLSPTGLIGLLLIATLFILPKGIAGTTGAAWRRRAARRTDAERAAPPEATATPVAPSPSPPPAAAAVAGDTPLLCVRGLQKRFGGLQAVGGVDLDVTAGRVHAIIGPNGAGKSTLANLITGVYRVDDGTVALGGQDITGWPAHRAARAGIARTFQTPQLFLDQTVIENVKAGFRDTAQLPLWRAAVKPPGQYRRAIELDAETHALLRRVGLDDVAHRPAMELSYGQQRTVEIARALAGNPSLLILDEPAAGLNPTETMKLGELLAELCAEGLGMILVEHHMDLVTSVAAEVTCMHQGEVLANGDVAAVLSDEAVVAAYLGHTVDSVTELEASR